MDHPESGIIQPTIRAAEDFVEEAEQHPGGLKGFFKDLGEKLKITPNKIADTIRSVNEAINPFSKGNSHELGKLFGKTSDERTRKIILTLLLTGVATVLVCNWGATILDLITKDGHAAPVPTPEGQGEPQHDDYEIRALASWQKYQREGPIPGKMLDPMAIDNPETRLVTGYFPGWFCVPEGVAICEEMVGQKLNIPEDEITRKLFFTEMRLNWDTEWWPKVQANPSLPQDVKDFYDPSNRDNLRQWFRDQYPIAPTPESSARIKATVADKMFVDFIQTGKLVPNRPDFLTYSHLLASFVAGVYTSGVPILIPMTEKGFMVEEAGAGGQGGMLPPNVREALRMMEIVSKAPNSNLLHLEPYTSVVNNYYQFLEERKGLKPGSLGRM
ncbi:hypothetical protein KKH13_03945 [Patescibacteria group bacterium]|nr:hypothetical protein [Patescibacteria group bacterium]